MTCKAEYVCISLGQVPEGINIDNLVVVAFETAVAVDFLILIYTHMGALVLNTWMKGSR